MLRVPRTLSLAVASGSVDSRDAQVLKPFTAPVAGARARVRAPGTHNATRLRQAASEHKPRYVQEQDIAEGVVAERIGKSTVVFTMCVFVF